jgi:hypothetical protein
MKVQDLKVGDKFKMNGLTVSGKQTKVKCEMIRYNGMDKYVVVCQGISILVDGNDEVFV